jgi:hypothetical protein
MIVALSICSSLGRFSRNVYPPACPNMLPKCKNLRFIRSVRLSRGIDSTYFHALIHRLLWMEKGSIGSLIPPVTMTTFNETQVQQALEGSDLSQEERDLLQDWLEGNGALRNELTDEVTAILGTIAPASTSGTPPSTSGLSGFSEEELRTLLPRLSSAEQAAYETWTKARASSTKRRLEAVFLPELMNARNSVRLEQRKLTLLKAFGEGTIAFERLSEGEITILLGGLGHEESQILLARASLAQARLAALYQGLATFSRSRGNTTCFGLTRYRTDAEILSALQRGVDPLAVPPRRPLQRFIWKLRGWDV